MSALDIAMKALERLARLGNGDALGNSDGNMIARDALAAIATQQQATPSANPTTIYVSSDPQIKLSMSNTTGLPLRVTTSGMDGSPEIELEISMDKPSATIDSEDFRKLSFAYAKAIMHGSVPQSSETWGTLVDHIDARLAAAGMADKPQWLPIESAPLHKGILLWWKHCKEPGLGRWYQGEDGYGWKCDDDQCLPINQSDCTHWMPLPVAPAMTQDQKGG